MRYRSAGVVEHVQAPLAWCTCTGCGPQALELQYYEAMMGLVERAGAPSGAAAFASAAVQQVDAALGARPEGRLRREGRLWANLFEYALQGLRFEVWLGRGPPPASATMLAVSDGWVCRLARCTAPASDCDLRLSLGVASSAVR